MRQCGYCEGDRRSATTGWRSTNTSCDLLARIDREQEVVLLIGPMGTGKSTVGRLLAQRLQLPPESLDTHRWRYYEEAGFQQAEMDRLHHTEGPPGVLRYWKQFDVHAVEQFLREYPRGVLDFGAGHSVYDSELDLRQVERLLAPYANVVLLLPSPDLDESVQILAERNTPKIGGVELNRYLLTHPTSRELAQIVVYTENKTPEETSGEILERCRQHGLVVANS
jgi:energy-coupling factor transporter ATP-binding protein EcfA2